MTTKELDLVKRHLKITTEKTTVMDVKIDITKVDFYPHVRNAEELKKLIDVTIASATQKENFSKKETIVLYVPSTRPDEKKYFFGIESITIVEDLIKMLEQQNNNFYGKNIHILIPVEFCEDIERTTSEVIYLNYDGTESEVIDPLNLY